MSGFLIKRLLQAIFVVLVVVLFVSYAVRLSGDPALMLSQGAGSVTEEDLQNIRTGLGLDRPFLVQYGDFLGGAVRGDFGQSFMGGTPVARLIGDALPATLALAFVSLLLSIVVSVPMGIKAAVNKGKGVDQFIRIISLVGLSFPNFWLAIMLVLLLSITFPLLPPSGWDGPISLVLPALTMAIILSATNVRLVRTAMLETLSAQYIMVARSKGLRERVVLYKHALRNCAIPLITYIGLQFGNLIGGLVVVEKVFNWPGLGTLAFDAIANRDYPVLQGTVTVLAVIIVAVNLLVDIAYGLVDPRIRNK
ncbi:MULTISPECIES: ABC transporter permease [unclassified Polaromonas]|uniref:ABC transporter permease n=1 Tax=unclassified Polaromonas TaxID=2638319 RepID=UPI0018CAF646|nr:MULTISPECIES: ABC transporter permease [unclassified Polaromonas]MBG6071701.1 peptide/nickel transport system permease protein [Polaromonas sp. CG_9.7]MBG6113702.1 peptide/nickel transport system permease protein [Polaromonas sp. CG_9.2]MDH6184398.1 peptide/nickel transport system permease protein [Polaromonas sp. CG_23.6]